MEIHVQSCVGGGSLKFHMTCVLFWEASPQTRCSETVPEVQGSEPLGRWVVFFCVCFLFLSFCGAIGGGRLMCPVCHVFE